MKVRAETTYLTAMLAVLDRDTSGKLLVHALMRGRFLLRGEEAALQLSPYDGLGSHIFCSMLQESPVSRGVVSAPSGSLNPLNCTSY